MGSIKTTLTNNIITGELRLDQNELFIEVDLKLKTSIPGFIYVKGCCEVIEVGQFKGLAFSYYNSTNPEECDNGEIPAKDPPQVNINDNIYYSNFRNWEENNHVRIILLNEKQYSNFKAMIPYFREYLEIFRDDPAVDLSIIDSFNDVWNYVNPNYRVNIACDGIGIRTPRFTKDGGVLTLKLRS